MSFICCSVFLVAGIDNSSNLFVCLILGMGSVIVFVWLFIKLSENRACSKLLSTCINYQFLFVFWRSFSCGRVFLAPNGINCSEKQQGCYPVLLFTGIARNIPVSLGCAFLFTWFLSLIVSLFPDLSLEVDEREMVRKKRLFSLLVGKIKKKRNPND